MSVIQSVRFAAVSAAIVLGGCVSGAIAQEPTPDAQAEAPTGYPLVGGDFWEVAAINLEPGGGYAYAEHLATKWKDSQEFAKSKGWVKDYMVLANNYPRDGEPDLYLISIMESIPTGPEGEAQGEEYRAWAEASASTLSEESGDRAEIRRLSGVMLLQQLNFK